MNDLKYTDLKINERINAKAHCLIFYPGSTGKVLMARVKGRMADLYFPYSCLLLENPGVHNNRNYEPKEPDYNGWSKAEEQWRMAQYQKLK